MSQLGEGVLFMKKSRGYVWLLQRLIIAAASAPHKVTFLLIKKISVGERVGIEVEAREFVTSSSKNNVAKKFVFPYEDNELLQALDLAAVQTPGDSNLYVVAISEIGAE